jgi:hypothetical protein
VTLREIIEQGSGSAGSGGSWRVETEETAEGITLRNLYHYATRMLTWNADSPRDSAFLYFDTGHGSVSDQGGMNTAFDVLGLPYYFSRRGGAEILSLNVEAERKRIPLYLRKFAAAGRADLLPSGWPRSAIAAPAVEEAEEILRRAAEHEQAAYEETGHEPGSCLHCRGLADEAVPCGSCGLGLPPSPAASMLAAERQRIEAERQRIEEAEAAYLDTHGAEAEAMRKLGSEHGRAAASWLLNGDSSEADARRLLDGIEEGDPEVLDALPNPPSGEWAGDPTAEDLIREAGLDVPEEPEAVEELWQAYSDGFGTGAHEGAEAEARAWLGLDSERGSVMLPFVLPLLLGLVLLVLLAPTVERLAMVAEALAR